MIYVCAGPDMYIHPSVTQQSKYSRCQRDDRLPLGHWSLNQTLSSCVRVWAARLIYGEVTQLWTARPILASQARPNSGSAWVWFARLGKK